MEKLKINHNLNKSIHHWGEFRTHVTSGSYSIQRCLTVGTESAPLQASVFSAVFSSQLTTLGTHPASPSGEAGLNNLEPTSHDVSRGAAPSGSSHLSDSLCWGSLVRGAEQTIVEVSTFWASSWLSLAWFSLALWCVSASGLALALKFFSILEELGPSLTLICWTNDTVNVLLLTKYQVSCVGTHPPWCGSGQDHQEIRNRTSCKLF